MKNRLKISIYGLAFMLSGFFFASCEDMLDKEPLSDVTPADYLWNDNDLGAYAIARYGTFPSHSGWNPGTHGYDNHTDNQATTNFSNIWVPGEWRVPQSGGSWGFGNIRQCNFFLETVVPRWKNESLTGNVNNIKHYIGEVYFIRAYEYFEKVQALGDFPIIKGTLPDDREVLRESSKRAPRNEVVRFIIQDLDSAIMLMHNNPPGGKNRLTRLAAQNFKSRVALHEASWLTYHRGTAHVPGGPGWPGASHHPGFSIDLDAEIDYFLDQAMESASAVADTVTLANNTKDDGYDSSANPYFTMFADFNLDRYDEVLFWRDYNNTHGIIHHVSHYIGGSGANTGYTRGFVDNFLMSNGLPIYDPGSGFAGDDSVQSVKYDRDNRLQIFMKVPGEIKVKDITNANGEFPTESRPQIVGASAANIYVTGYAVKKGMSYLSVQNGQATTTGSIVFRAVEAYLNYIEASYLKNGYIDAIADTYWRAIRERAGVNPDYTVTIAATDMSREAENDFAAYSGGQLLSDATLYNIRRERRSEFIAEGMRLYDLKRWRALDQLATNPYIIEGFKLWGGTMEKWYFDEIIGLSLLIQPGTPFTPNVSSSQESEYLRPYRIVLDNSNWVKDGYKWTPAHYLDPIAAEHFTITSDDPDNPETSIIYQNPGWAQQANSGPTSE